MMSRPHRFVVVASQRTGSTLLIRSLDTSPEVFCAGELFHGGPGIHHSEFQFPYRFLGSRRLARIRDRLSPPSRVECHLKHFYGHMCAGVKAVGFKLMMTHAALHPAIMPFLANYDVTYFYLYRRDSFATALSYYKARYSGVYHSDRASRRQSGPELVADESEFKKLLKSCQADKVQLFELHANYGGRLMAYEDMVSNWNDFIATIGADVGLPNLRVEQSLSRVGVGDQIVRIVNEGLLRDRFQDSSTG